MRRLFAFLLGLLGGAAVGVATAMLLTPSSGEELRSDLQRRLGALRGELQAAADQRRAELERQLEAMRNPRREIPLEER